MKKLMTALTAAAFVFGGVAATGAHAQVRTRTVVVDQHHERHWSNNNRGHSRRVCNTVWRNHHRVQKCRTVRR